MHLSHLPIYSAALPLKNLRRFADIRLGDINLRSEAAVENLVLLTNKEVFILLWALV